MVKQSIGDNFTYPMPVVMVGAVINGSPNFMTAAWFTTLNVAPPLIGISLGKGKQTTQGVLETSLKLVVVPHQYGFTDRLKLWLPCCVPSARV